MYVYGNIYWVTILRYSYRASTEILDVNSIYHQLMDNYESTDTEADVDIFQPGPSSTTRSLRPLTTRNFCNPDDWKVEARKLLDALWRCEDSAPFRAPVDHIKHPGKINSCFIWSTYVFVFNLSDYYQIIDTPMDLSSVKEDLCGGNYKTPNDFYKDMKLIFQNSKNYNTNKRSRVSYYLFSMVSFLLFVACILSRLIDSHSILWGD